MSPDSYIASVSTFLGSPSRLPAGWLACNGQTLRIQDYQPLYSIIGNRYGGSQAAQTFALPALNPNGQPDEHGRLAVICCNGMYPAPA